MPADRAVLRVAGSAPFGSLLTAVERTVPWDAHYLPVLTYHRIEEPGASPLRYPGLVSATPRDLDRQLGFLAARMQPVSILDVLDAVLGGPRRRLPRRAVLVTFDDATVDFARSAWPIARRHRIPVTLFVPTAFPGDPGRRFWWDELYAAVRTTTRRAVREPAGGSLALDSEAQRTTAFRTLVERIKAMDHDRAMAALRELIDELGTPPSADRSVLDWSELRQLAAEGVTLAAHTRGHPLLTRVTKEVAMEELRGSRADLEREVGPTPPVFAYPSGAWNETAAGWVRAAGFELAFTTDRGVNHVPTAPRQAWKRINVGSRASLGVLRAQLLPITRALPGWVRRDGR